MSDDNAKEAKMLSREEWYVFLAALKKVAEADGDYSASEKNRLEYLIRQYGLEDDQYARKLISEEKIEEIRNVKRITARIWLREAITLAYCDGVYSEEEKKEIRRISEIWSLTEEDVRKFEKWVEQGRDWMMEGRRLVYDGK